MLAQEREVDFGSISVVSCRRKDWQVLDASAKSLQGFVADVIEPGDMVHTDGWSGYMREAAAS